MTATTKDRITEDAAQRRLVLLGYKVAKLPDGRIEVSGPGWTVKATSVAPLLQRLAKA